LVDQGGGLFMDGIDDLGSQWFGYMGHWIDGDGNQ